MPSADDTANLPTPQLRSAQIVVTPTGEASASIDHRKDSDPR
ncbi:hypothetical protein KEM60_00658 [Austwickia sp. TVS 96-490-7B]|nr:hypothetical protein [Austwickia sp. TVS 96-490-7B]